MVLNIVKKNLSTSDIVTYVKNIFATSKVEVQKEYSISVDIAVTGKNVLHSLEGLKELECYFKDYDIRVY
jgi:hypothetical protein